MEYECKAKLEDGEVVELRFKQFSRIPGRISRHNQGNSEKQLWGSLAWGLIEPKHWPVDTDGEGMAVFDDMPMEEIMKVHNGWQEYSGVTQGESSASTTSSENTETS
jgi:hypothetical protein